MMISVEWVFLMGILSVLLTGMLWLNLSCMKKQLAYSQRDIRRLMNEFRAISSGNIGIGKKIIRHEAVINRLDAKVEELDFEFAHPKSYEQAAKMIEKGLDMEDVSSTCELSRGETDLLALMQRNKNRPNIFKTAKIKASVKGRYQRQNKVAETLSQTSQVAFT